MTRRASVIVMAIAALCVTPGCGITWPLRSKPPTVVATSGSEAKLAGATAAQSAEASAAVQAARDLNSRGSDDVAKNAVEGTLAVAAGNLPVPSAKATDDLRKIGERLFAGDGEGARKAWSLRSDLAQAQAARIAELQATVARERAESAETLKRQIDEARNQAKAEADAKLNFWLQIGLFGGGALLIVAGLASLQLAAAIPFLGPNITRLLFAAGGSAFALGLLIRSIDRFVDQHPVMFYSGLIALALGLIGAAVLFYANHHHHSTAGEEQ